MAIGDIDGDLPATYGTKKKQTSYDMTNFPVGPVGRASQQLGAAPAPIAQTAAPAPQSLATIPVAPQPGLASVSSLPSAIPVGQTSFDSTNTPSQYQRPIANVSTPAPPQSLGSVSVQAPAPVPANSLDQFRGTGIGTGAMGGQIAVSQGADGVPSFSNSNAAQQQALSLGNIPVQTASRLPASDNPNSSLSSLGDIGNLGNGRGTFSQAQAGDAALATGRFNRAADLRQGYADQDRLRAAQSADDRANSLTIVPDSSRRLTPAEERQADRNLQASALAKQGRLADISAASSNLDSGIQRQGAQQQLRQASRLEDLQVAATGPNATPQAQAAYRQAIDPTGEKALGRQLTQANINKTNADADKATAEASGSNPQAQLTRLNVEKAQRELDQQPRDVERTQQSQLATFDQALGSVDSLLGTKVNPKNPNGPRLDEDQGLKESLGRFNGLLPTLPAGPAADFEARLDTLKAQTFLPQVAALKGTGALSDAEGKKLSDSVGALSTKMSPEAFRKSLQEVRSTLSSARERAQASRTPVAPGAPRPSTSGPQVGAVQGGYVFLGGDPSSPSSWRAQ